MNVEKYEKLKNKYGDIASWAIWKRPDGRPKSNMKDVSMFDDDSVISQLNCNYVFIGLNGSGVHDEYMDNERPWHNFHSCSPHGNDYKLRYALMDTPFWGAYITDVIKRFQEVDSNHVMSCLKANPDIVRNNITELKEELALLDSKPTLIALGSNVYDIIAPYLSDDYDIRQIHHYSYTAINKESYREEILSLLNPGDSERTKAVTPISKGKKSEVKKEIKAVNSGHEETVYQPSAEVPEALKANLTLFGLDKDSDWDGDNREKLIGLYSEALKNGEYELRYNLTDSIKKGINLFRHGEPRRVMGFEKRKDKMFMIFPTSPFYDEIKRKYPLPEPNPKKSQPHILLTYIQLWELLCAI